MGDQDSSAGPDLEALRRRLVAVSPADSPEETFATLADIERRLRLEAGTGCDAASLAADLRHWQRLCRRLGLNEQSQRAAAELEQLVSHDVDAWSESVRGLARRAEPDADELLEALDQAIGLSFELRDASNRGPEARDKLETDRSELRAVFELTEPSSAPEAARERWVTRWIDRAEIVLAETDDTPPREAAYRLRELGRELRWLGRCLRRGRAARRLKRKARRLFAEAQERALQGRLEAIFGERAVAFAERAVLGLTFVVVGLLAVEASVSLPSQVDYWFLVMDTAACGIFLLEYVTKATLAEGSARWALRHALVDFVPSIPFGLLLQMPGDAARLGRLGRLLRLPRLLRYIRVLRPLIRGIRALGLLVRGFDRLVRRYGRLLNHNVILYPTEEELSRAGEGGGGLDAARQIQLAARGRWQRLLAVTTEAERERVADQRLEALAHARTLCRSSAGAAASEPAVREIPAGVLLRRLERVQPETVEAVLGPELVSQSARAVRLLASPPMVYLPVIRQCMPSLRKGEDDSSVLARAARRVAGRLKRVHDGWFWVADLHGTVTPSQFVDRVGGVMVKGAFRPAYKLGIAAGGLIVVQLLLQIASSPLLKQAREWIFNFAGIPIMALGAVCMVVVGVGWWLQRLAQDATEFYERSAKAQFLALTDRIRKRAVERDGHTLYERVLRPHHRIAGLAEDADAFVTRLQGSMAEHTGQRADEADERLGLLYRDWADGAPLTDSDTRATSQLLGDPCMQGFLDRAQRMDADDRKGLQQLDLERQKQLIGGPYLWFNLITRSVAHSVACMLVEYNRHAIPLAELDRVPDAQREAYRSWLASGQSSPEPADNRRDDSGYMTTAFTALHFLDGDPERDAAVERRFGTEVRERLERDRQLMIRRIFGTWPLHEQPKAKRTVNLYRFYERWLGGGRALLIPVWLLGAAWAVIKRGLGWLIEAVREIYDPQRRASGVDSSQADFAAAARKINRIHGPLVDATIRLRARLDPEYLGFPVPGEDPPTAECAAVDNDLAFFRAEAALREAVDRERSRTTLEMDRLRELIDDGLLERAAAACDLDAGTFDSPRHRRAAMVSYCADLDGVRNLLSPVAVLRAIAEPGEGQAPLSLVEHATPRLRAKGRYRRFVRVHRIDDTAARAALWRAVRENTDGAADALEVWAKWGERAQGEGERRLADQLMRVTRIGEQLLTLRAIQTMALLDLIHYRDHIHRLGGYGDAAERDAWVRSSFTRPMDDNPAWDEAYTEHGN